MSPTKIYSTFVHDQIGISSSSKTRNCVRTVYRRAKEVFQGEKNTMILQEESNLVTVGNRF